MCRLFSCRRVPPSIIIRLLFTVFKMDHLKELLKKLLHIEDTPERTALAFSIGIFLGFSPFLGFHTLTGLAIAILFRLNRVAILLGVWSNTPWWLVPYYTVATWLGMQVIRFRINWATLREIFRLGMEQGFIGSDFWIRVSSQWGFLLSFMIGSLILAALLGLVAYPLSLKWIRFYRAKRGVGIPSALSNSKSQIPNLK
jgi:uncharacterized protein (DUF2062 family)